MKEINAKIGFVLFAKKSNPSSFKQHVTIDKYRENYMENLQNLNQHIETLNKTIKSLEKKLNIKLADEEEKSKILNKMLDELTNTHSPNVDRFEGFYTYIVSNKLESLIREKNWLVGVILSASIIDD